ncbi:hypothetical protein HAP47_0009915 [Bradyrhizobium sp. 41S5]|uniref:hypothetical protein n=1 Tax=Bradyrhizobium sp. 41S5 TaxID=1404443 RepID=UPI00156A8D0C|nr:hypothetical protein [Bradyrhizobium sp. 41S5]UFX46951.1 hypothetical protein HAP47_0009915 [Bradyrhizobium sp. 41S5]
MKGHVPRIALSGLTFTGKDKTPVGVSLQPNLNVLWGASNTGKSFTAKTIDFMLGGSRALPDITERDGYERAWLALTLPKSGPSTLVRALAGGAFELLSGHVLDFDPRNKERRKLAGKHNAARPDNVSQFLLGELSLAGQLIADDVYGHKRPLSFRDLVRYCLVDEASIQSETSPAESGQFVSPTEEHSVLKLLLTGQDDSAIETVVDRKTFTTKTNAKLEMLDELLKGIADELASDFPKADELQEQSTRLEETLAAVQQEVQAAQESIRGLLSEKSRLAKVTFQREQRRAEIQINFGRFEQLELVYASDIKRLEAIEEAGFVLTLSGDQPCPLCGASPEDQTHSHGMNDIKRARAAANFEIEKIRKQQGDLRLTIEALNSEGLQIEEELAVLGLELEETERDLGRLAPGADDSKRKLDDVLSVRDRVRKGLDLLMQQKSLVERREQLVSAKPASKADRPQLGVPSSVMHDFAQKVSEVLAEWQFPGRRHVSFDDGAYDMRIDGKHRKDNGKGVRAVTHSAFKVALLLFCQERGLPHPGFLLLDTPLLTYRDPIKGPLAADEQELSNTSLKEFFFEHLSKVSKGSQIIVVENVDLPSQIGALAHVETFTGDPSNDRFGLFPRNFTPRV